MKRWNKCFNQFCPESQGGLFFQRWKKLTILALVLPSCFSSLLHTTCDDHQLKKINVDEKDNNNYQKYPKQRSILTAIRKLFHNIRFYKTRKMPVYIVVQCATTIIRVTLTITTRIMPRTTATIMTRGTEPFSFTLFSEAETTQIQNQHLQRKLFVTKSDFP